MSYIGKTPTVGNFIKLDDISTSSTNSYTLQHNSVNFSPESALHMMVSLNGVIQAPNTSYSVSGSTITFLPSSGTLSASDSIDFIMVYGNVLDVGVATTVTDSAITRNKLNLISDASNPSLIAKGTSGVSEGYIQLNCAENSHGIKLKSPPHSAGASYTLTFPNDDGSSGEALTTNGSGVLSWASAGGSNTPFFYGEMASHQTVARNTQVKLTGMTDDEIDTASAFDGTTFTVPSGQGGKYYIFAQIQVDYELAGDDGHVSEAVIYVNGSAVKLGKFREENKSQRYVTIYTSGIFSLSATHTVELYVQLNDNTGNNARVLNANTSLGGYKLIE